MSSAYGATVAKRRLSRRLSELRVESGYTANQVCDRLNWGRGKVGRFEANVWVRPEMSDIRDLLRIYGADEEVAKDLEELAALARTRAWWRDYSDVFDNEFPGFEDDAVRISTYMPLILPAPLQTPAYMEAQMRFGTRSSAWRNRAVGARLRRQEILDRGDGTAPDLVSVITEASLMYRWGSQIERRAQIGHLVEMSRRSNIELRLLRFADGPHPGMCGPINIFDFPDGEPSVAYVETDFALQEVSKPKEVEGYKEIFDQARAAALESPATTAYLKQLAESLE
ncbi:Scr1 family TA system antitoxin-like transcriptional regulator [Actinopolymorpha pittospori]|uniref:Transcriptional regulator with XRE-family HTH domain n=1 Tax=Actinopolymorpha pittospori TaxID=648752 RepID=A0A927MTX2_9ACTN|nr:transcriptional regulator with XRE-family HTH domain [Actinopolymorpha pittospori]